MKTIKLILILAVLTLPAHSAWAYSVTIPDNVDNWPGWTIGAWSSNTPYTSWNGTALNNTDFIGVPDIRSTTFTIDNGDLTNISVSMYISDPSDWAGGILPGDFFLNTNPSAGMTWTYDIHNPTNLSASSSLPTQSTANWNIYKTSIPYGSPVVDHSDYVMSTVYTQNTGDWIWRYNEPIQATTAELKGDPIVGSANFSTVYDDPKKGPTSVGVWPSQFGISAGYYTVNIGLGEGINLGNTGVFDFGWQVSCANDVTYGTVDYPTPEPGTMLLVGLGAAGVAFMRRRNTA